MSFLAEVIEGLSAREKSLPSKWLYDTLGSALFEAICVTPEYYPTRVELGLLARAAPEVADRMGEGGLLVEFGSGASLKTRLLLDAAPGLGGYVPVDISETALKAAADAVARDYPNVRVSPVVGDFTRPQDLELPRAAGARFGFFPGSTLGNFAPEDAVAFLAGARRMLGRGAAFLIGLDLVKPVEVLQAAYDDAAGVTSAFDKNVLARINRELGADFQLDLFHHRAIWNAVERRMEMRLEAASDHHVTLAGRTFSFASGEMIHTESSYKFTLDGFAELAGRAGWRVGRVWSSDPPEAFADVLLEAEAD